MSPEQAENAAASPAADLWSLGATLFNALEATPPYQGPNYASVLLLLLTQEPPAPRNAGPLTPIITSLLNKDPRRRPTAEQVAGELATILRDAAPAPAPQPPPTPPATSAGTTGRTPAARKTAKRRAPRRTAWASRQTANRTPSAAGPVPPAPAKTPGRTPSPARRSVGLGRRATLTGAAAAGVVGLVVALVLAVTHGGEHGPGRAASAAGAAVKTGPGLTGAMAFSPNGKILAVGEADQREPVNYLELFNAPAHVQPGTITLGDLYPVSVVFSPDGRRFAVGGLDGLIEVRDVFTHKKIAATSARPADFVEDDVYGLKFEPGRKVPRHLR